MRLTVDHAPGELAVKAAAAVRRLLELAAADGDVDGDAVRVALDGCDHGHGPLMKAARSTEATARRRTPREMGEMIQTPVGRAIYGAGISTGERERRAMLNRLRAELKVT